MNIFLDTNVIIDFLADRKPFSASASALFQKSLQGQLRLFTSSHAIATTHYMLKKVVAETTLRNILLDLTEFVTVIAIDGDLIKRGLISTHKDFEDALQILAAGSIKNMNYIATRNPKHFSTSEIPALPPDQILLQI